MSFPPLEKALERISNRYLLVVLSAKRSRQLNRGATSQVESKRKKWTSVALEEVIAGKVHPKSKEPKEPKEPEEKTEAPAAAAK
jgi:DNA-directed RNA polymerase subunit omega